MSASWDEARRDGRFARGAAGGPLWHFLKGFIKHPVMVGSIIPSSKAVIDKMLAPVDWANCKLFVEYGPGVGTFTEHVLRRMAPDATLIAIDTNDDFVRYLTAKFRDNRLLAVNGSAADVRQIIADCGFEHADYILSGLPFSTLPAGVGPAIADADLRGARAPAAPSSSISSRPRCAITWRPISTASTAASNGSTSRPATCSGAGRRRPRLGAQSSAFLAVEIEPVRDSVIGDRDQEIGEPPFDPVEQGALLAMAPA